MKTTTSALYPPTEGCRIETHWQHRSGERKALVRGAAEADDCTDISELGWCTACAGMVALFANDKLICKTEEPKRHVNGKRCPECAKRPSAIIELPEGAGFTPEEWQEITRARPKNS